MRGRDESADTRTLGGPPGTGHVGTPTWSRGDTVTLVHVRTKRRTTDDTGRLTVGGLEDTVTVRVLLVAHVTGVLPPLLLVVGQGTTLVFCAGRSLAGVVEGVRCLRQKEGVKTFVIITYNGHVRSQG